MSRKLSEGSEQEKANIAASYFRVAADLYPASRTKLKKRLQDTDSGLGGAGTLVSLTTLQQMSCFLLS